MIFTTPDPDPSWSPAIVSRRAVLWLGRSWAAALDAQGDISTLVRLFSAEWAAVYLDAPEFPAEEVRARSKPAQGRSRLRVLAADPDAIHLAANSIPVYSLHGLDANTRAVPSSLPTGPQAALTRLKMLAKSPSEAVVFAVGIEDTDSLAQMREALELSEHFGRLVVVSPHTPDLADIDAPRRVITHWQVQSTAFVRLVEQTIQGEAMPAAPSVRVAGRTGFFSLDLERCIDGGYPITDRFELITEFDVRSEYRPSTEALEAYMNDPTSSWLPYATGMPYNRHSGYEKSLRKILESFRHVGAGAACTAWIPAEDGSGATTVLRQICFNIAREGYPVLLARGATESFDFKQVAAFLTAASQRAAQIDLDAADVPWVVAFDAQHVQRNWDFVAGLCNGLKKLMRSAVVLGVLPRSAERDEHRQRAAGANRELGERLRNTLASGDAAQLGRHLNRFLPPAQHRTESEWSGFLAETSQIDPTLGSRSLFWLALRFWLFRFRPVEGSFRQWFARTLVGVVGEDPRLMAALLEVAVLGKYRLAMPSVLLDSDVLRDVAGIYGDPANPLGLRDVRSAAVTGVVFSHPLLAEELLRIARNRSDCLRAIEMSTCMSLLDLELHLFERLFRREAIGRRECIPTVEELVTSALRVDERDAPRNFEVRDRIVSLLERAPDPLWDGSQVFNHHLAKARRHLAMKPPHGDSSWVEGRIREQLQLAENHLLDALTSVTPSDEDRREPPLNLYVSLALTYNARARRESEWGHADVALNYETKAAEAFRKAQSIDGDNTYVLENYARFMIHRAEQLGAGEERTRLLVDAITLLEQERLVDLAASRESPILEELSRAFEHLASGDGARMLRHLADSGSEAAHVALAKLAMRSDDESDPDDSVLAEAEQILNLVPAAARTWRSMLALYRIVAARRPYALLERHELLEELAGTEFAWPLQLRLERAILAHQLGKHLEGQKLFSTLRDDLSSRGSPLFVSAELRFLADATEDYRKPLVTSLIVENTSSVGRNLWGIPDGWGTIRVPFRPYMFNRDVFRQGTEISCMIQFTNFGPQAIPPAEHEIAT